MVRYWWELSEHTWKQVDKGCPTLGLCFSLCQMCISGVSWHLRCFMLVLCAPDSLQSNLSFRRDVFFFLPVLSPFATWEIFALSAVIHVLFITRGNKPLELYYVVARQQSDLNANWYRQEVMLHQLSFAVSLVAAGFKCCSRKPTTSYLWQSPSFF